MTELTDEAVEAAAKAIYETPHDHMSREGYDRAGRNIQDLYRNEARRALLAAFPHLTDDGAAAPPADNGAANTPAAERATTTVAPSSPRITDEAVEAALDVLFDHGHNGIKCYDPQSGLDATVRAALEAALPHLEGATPVAEQIATVIEEYADDLEPPTTVEWLELRDWFKDLLHEVAARARGIGEGATPAIDREALDDILRSHTIECTGPGEVTCRGCRDLSWMSWQAYRRHVTDAIIALIGGVS